MNAAIPDFHLGRLSRRGVDHVFKKGRRRSVPAAVLIVLRPNADAPRAVRLAVVVGKKIHRDAVRRNRLRRILRESFRLNAVAFPAADCVLIARDQSRDLLTRQEADAVIRGLLK